MSKKEVDMDAFQCDRCKNLIVGEDPNQIKYEDQIGIPRECDLCADCVKELDTFMANEAPFATGGVKQ